MSKRFWLPVLLAALLLNPSGILRAEEVSLPQALELFFRSNYDILADRFEIDKAYGDFIAARLIPNPSFSVNYSGWKPSFSRTDNTQNSYRLEQLIELGGKRGYRIRASAEALEAARLGHQDTIRTLLVGFYTTYFNLVLSELDLDFAREDLERFDRVLVIGEKQYGAGFLSLIGYTKLKLARVDLENSLTALRNQYKNDLESFRLLLGAADGELKPVKEQIPEKWREYRESDLLPVAFANRYDLLSLQKQENAAQATISLARAQRIPDLTVGGEYEQLGLDLESGVGVGVSISIPLFYRNKGEILRRTAEYKQIQVQIRKTQRQIEVDVRQALNSYRSGRTIFAAYETRKGEMDQLLGRTERAFSIGGITVLDLLDTRRTYRDFMTKYYQSATQSMLNESLIKVATGEMK